MFSRQVTRSLSVHARSRRALHTSSRWMKSEQHTTDSYNKDVDVTPPDDSKIHRVDPGNENSQKPYEAPAGKYSQVGAETAYQNVSRKEPYKAPGEDQRWGGKEEYYSEKGPETSKPSGGPEGKAKGGMKP
ncbi:hypothetical protein V5O48_000795 [Marasmius crinis-equi]|uniref:Uncharacterized protein n=1 Tax=Marasmius crinis-equi TaxID=585013 RepID=A0ABR3G077_9AGAR